ncbi:ATP-binding protein, partial [Streptomyces boluensis]
QAPPRLAAPPAPRLPAYELPAHELPVPLTPLIGRDAAVASLVRQLGTHRLITVTGPGGVGKTRLAVAAASAAADRFPDGVVLVELAAAAGAVEQVSAALAVREDAVSDLRAALRSRTALLVLDNCEQLSDEVAALAARLLASAPGLRILATSRQPLGVPGELVSVTAPLAGQDAVRLFTERASAALPGFTVEAGEAGEAGDAESVAVICRRLDGIPFALELAATRVRSLDVRTLATRLDDRFRLLSDALPGEPARRRTLRAMIDWSWELLTDEERHALRRLALHADGFTLRSADAVCGADALPEVLRLVDRSLVMPGKDGRYRLSETITAYGLERLTEADEFEDAAHLHGMHFAEAASQAAPLLHGQEGEPGSGPGSGQRDALLLLDAETANLRAALGRAVRHGDAVLALRLVTEQSWYWFLRGRIGEARRSLGDALGVPGQAPAALRADAAVWRDAFDVLAGAGRPDRTDRTDRPDEELSRADAAAPRAQWFLGHALMVAGADLPLGEQLVAQALVRLRSYGDTWGTAAALSSQATAAMLRGDLDTLRRRTADSHPVFEELGDAWGLLRCGYAQAGLAEVAGDHVRAAALHEEGVRLAEELGHWTEAADRITGLGRIALLRRDFTASRELHERARRLAHTHGYAAGAVHAEIGLALCARREGDLDRAEELLHTCLDWHRAREFDPGPALLLAELGFVAELRGDAATARALHRQGLAGARAGSDPRAVALALEGLAGAESLAGDSVQAARLLGEAARARAKAGAPLPDGERGDVDRITTRTRQALGEARFATEYGA